MGKNMEEYGKANKELFTQFVARISRELPNATLAMFSKIKYINAPNFEDFRKIWDSDYLGGFIVPSKVFDGLKGDFPIGFFIWKTSHGDGTLSQIGEISVDVLDKNAQPIGEKSFFNIPNNIFLNEWIRRPKTNGVLVIPLKNCTAPATSLPRVTTWSDTALAYMNCAGNDLQQA